jgi:putative transposase
LVQGMTRRRIIEPGQTWALSRRTTRRYFLLNPDESRELEQCYWYCLSLAASRFGVVVHAGCLMSTHSHEVVTDVRGVLPHFLQEFHRLLALTTKALRGWPGEVFDKRSTGQHALLTPEATLEALAYLIANPVEAGAVRYARDWPGAHTEARDIGTRVIRIKRPSHYFDPDNSQWPEVSELRLEMPAALELDYGLELAQRRIRERVKVREHRAWQESRRTGISFIGARRVLRQTHTKRARRYEAFGALNPRFAAGGRRAAATDAVKRIRAFNEQYDRALASWTSGKRSACFPVGTWWMRVFHGVRCGPAP